MHQGGDVRAKRGHILQLNLQLIYVELPRNCCHLHSAVVGSSHLVTKVMPRTGTASMLSDVPVLFLEGVLIPLSSITDINLPIGKSPSLSFLRNMNVSDKGTPIRTIRDNENNDMLIVLHII